MKQISITFFDGIGAQAGERVSFTSLPDFRGFLGANQRPISAPAKKHLPAWIGGTFAGDKRGKATHEASTVLALDVDSPPLDWLDAALTALEGRAFIIHSSPSYTPSTPRWRLLLPLSRPASALEYEATAIREMRALGGVEAFDVKASKSAAQLMFTPAYLWGVEPRWFMSGDGWAWTEPADASVSAPKHQPLTQRPQDAGRAPRASAPIHRPQPPRNPVSGPLERPIEAFKEALTVAAVIEGFNLPYERTGDPLTWRLKGSRSPAGLHITPDGRGCWSHHATDPAATAGASNAFELLAAHRGREYALKVARALASAPTMGVAA